MKPKQVLETLEAIRLHRRDMVPTEVPQIPRHDAVPLKMYWRTTALFDAIVLLARKGLLEEGLILARSLFVEALQLVDLAEAGPNRAAMAIAFERHSICEQRNLMRQAVDAKLETDAQPVFVALDARLNELNNYASRIGAAKGVKFRSPKDAAFRTGRHHDYWTYQLSHEMVHGSDAAMMYRTVAAPTGDLNVNNRTRDPKLLAEVARFSARSILQATRAAAAIFGWDLGARFADLSEAVESIAA